MTHGKQFTAIEVGQVSIRKGAALHLKNGCGWAAYLHFIDGTTVALTAKNAARTCRNCAKAIRAAIDKARELASRAQGYGRAVSEAARMALDVLADLFATDAQKARQAELVARYNAPVAPVKPTFASVLAGLGTRQNAPLIDRANARAARTHTLAA